jgi:macrolide-specific efflux system membrane fusion protein
VAKAELTRSTNSVRTFAGSVSESQLDLERLTVEKTALEQEQAEHERELQQFDVKLKEQARATARLQILRRRITSPLDGTVVEVFVRPGEWIEPGQKALRIVATDTLKAEGFVDAAHSTTNLQGAAVRLTTAESETAAAESFAGKVTFVSPEMDPITGQVRIWAEIENKNGKLRPGQRVRMWIAGE